MPNQTNYAKIGYYNDEFSLPLDSITKDMINRCLSTGYDGIMFELTVPVGTDGGLQTNLHFDHLFDLIGQLSARGVKTGILLNWTFNGGNASYVSQQALGQTLPAEFSMERMLGSMDQFLRSIAPKAQSNGLDLMIIANDQPDFFVNNYFDKWQVTIEAIRNIYSGNLSVSVHSDAKANQSIWPLISIWSLLDEVTLWAKPYISDVPITYIPKILSSYFSSEIDGSSLVNEVIDVANYSKKLIHLIFNAQALPNAMDTGYDPTILQSQTNPLPVRLDLQALAFETFIQIASQNLFKFVDSISLGNYEPWACDPSWNLPPSSGVDLGNWALWSNDKYFDLSLFPNDLHAFLSGYFSNKIAGVVANTTYASIANDKIYTNQEKQTVWLMGGIDQCFGGSGQENYVISSKAIESKLIVACRFWMHSVTDIDAAIEISQNGKIIGLIKSDIKSSDFIVDTWSDIKTLEMSLSEIDTSSVINVRFQGSSGIAEIDAMTLNGKSVNIHGGIPATEGRPTWAQDNWVSAGSGQSLIFDISSVLQKSSNAASLIDGGNGVDSIQFDKVRTKSSFVLSQQADSWTLTDPTEQFDTIQATHVERLHFSDMSVALDVNANAGEVAKTLGAVFGKAAVANKEYAGIGLHFVDDLNYSYVDLVQLAINARLGSNPTSAQVVDLLYTNVVGSAPDAATRKSFTDMLDNHTFTVASLGLLAADTELNKTNINLVGLATTGLEYIHVT